MKYAEDTMPISHATLLEGPSNRIEDRAEVIALERGVTVVADGAGGSGNGAHAAETVIERNRSTACSKGG